jgi:hypothetical protein
MSDQGLDKGGGHVALVMRGEGNSLRTLVQTLKRPPPILQRRVTNMGSLQSVERPGSGWLRVLPVAFVRAEATGTNRSFPDLKCPHRFCSDG